MSTPESDAYHYAIAEVTKAYQDAPNGEVLLAKITENFEKQFTNPPSRIFESLIGKIFTSDEVRCVLFRPTEEQARYYPIILKVTRNLPDDRKCEQRTSLTILSLIYLVHRKSWPFLREFILHDGLTEICYMINSSNHYYRGQAFEILLSITDCDTFDWFQPHDGNLIVRILHSKLLSLSKNTFFLSGLLENRKDSYPGGSFRALQLLAFWLSWVRAMMTENQILNLSSRTLIELKLWSMGNGPRNDKGVGTEIVESVDDEDEIKLAKTLYKDFSYEQFHRESSGDVHAGSDDNFVDSVSTLSIQTHIAVSFTDEERAAIFVSGFDESAMHFSSSSSSTHTQDDKNEDHLETTNGKPGSYIDGNDVKCGAACFAVTGTGNSPHEDVERAERAPALEEPYNRVRYVEASIQEARSLKEEGNRYFKLSQYTHCVTPYENAIAELESGLEVCQIQTSDKLLSDEAVESLLTLKAECDELLASLHFNKATAYWKLSELDAAPHTSAEQHSNSVLTYLDLCKSYCTIAISINPRHSKSVYRLCEALMRQNKSAEALRVIEEHSKLCPLDDLLRNLRRKSLAAFLSIQGPDEEPDLISTSPLTSSSTFSPKSSVSKSGRSAFKESAYIESESLCEITNAAIENHFVTEDIQRTDDNVRTGTSAHGTLGADVVVNTVGSRAAKVLKQLQARAGREISRNDHAYNGFMVPLGTDTQADFVPKDSDSTDIATNGKKETLHISVIESDGDSVERLLNHSKEIGSDRRMRKKLSKVQMSTISNDKNKNKKKAKKEKKGSSDNLKDREEKKRKSKDKHRGADKLDGDGDGEGGVCKMDGECSNRRDGSNSVAESLHKLRKLSILFDITFDKALAASNTTTKNSKTTSKGSSTAPNHDGGNDMGSSKVEDEGNIVINNDTSVGGGRAGGETRHADNGQEIEDCLDPVLIGLFDALDAQVHSAVEHLQNIWREGMTLKKVMGMSSVMEAEFLHFLVTIAIKCSILCPYDASNDESNLIVAARLLRELIKVERFGTVFHLIVHGKKVFRSSIDRTLDTILVHVQSQIAANNENQKSSDLFSGKHLKVVKKMKSDNEKSLTMVTLLKSSIHR